MRFQCPLEALQLRAEIRRRGVDVYRVSALQSSRRPNVQLEDRLFRWTEPRRIIARPLARVSGLRTAVKTVPRGRHSSSKAHGFMRGNILVA